MAESSKREWSEWRRETHGAFSPTPFVCPQCGVIHSEVRIARGRLQRRCPDCGYEYPEVDLPGSAMGYHYWRLDFLLDRLKTYHVAEQIRIVDAAFQYFAAGADVDPNLCFVLMPFQPRFDEIYHEIIKPVATSEEAKMKCERADEIYGTGALIDDIRQRIRSSAIVIAELTGRNPNVLYELGFAHALGTRAILLTQDMADVPVDVRHVRCIVYEDTAKGGKQLERDLKQTLFTIRREQAPRPDRFWDR